MDSPDAPPRPDRESRGSGPALRRGDPGRARRVGRTLAAPAQQRFGFLQFDIAGALGLADGRYLARDQASAKTEIEGPVSAEGGERVLVVQTLAEPPKPRKRPGRRPGREAALPEAVPVSRITVVLAGHDFGNEKTASGWMRSTAEDEKARDEAVHSAINLVNRALHASSVASGDPYVGELGPMHPLAARIGHGLGPELAEGNFTECLAIPIGKQHRRRRRDPVGPQERIAAILGGRQEPEACETFLLRARADLNAGRTREAALGLAVTLDTMVIELDRALSDPAHTADLNVLRAQQSDARDLAGLARRRVLSSAEIERVRDLIAVCERVLRRRRLLQG